MGAGKENSLPTAVGGKNERSKVKTRKEKSQRASNTGERRSGLRQQPARRILPVGLCPSADMDMRTQYVKTKVSKGRVSMKLASKASTGAVSEAKGTSEKKLVKKRYTEDEKTTVAKMAIERGDRVTGKHFGIHSRTVYNFKKAYLDKNRGGEEGSSTAQLQVTTGEGSTSSQERIIKDRENVGEDGRMVVDEEGNFQQVKVARVETDADITVDFDLCGGFKETDSGAKMKEILAMEKELHMKNQKKVLLEMETEELERKLEEKKKVLKQII